MHETEYSGGNKMARGSISHIALTVSDLERSTSFYNKVFEFIGFKSIEVPESTQQAMKTSLRAWIGPGYSNLDPAVERRVCAQGTRSKRSWI
jgi:hypothetical protein